MFHADYYETAAALSRIETAKHLRDLPQCVECGRQGCLVLRDEDCEHCGYGTDAVVIDGKVYCGYCR